LDINPLVDDFAAQLSEETVVKPTPMVGNCRHSILRPILSILVHRGYSGVILASGSKGTITPYHFLNFRA
jgi:hypothetical protein